MVGALHRGDGHVERGEFALPVQQVLHVVVGGHVLLVVAAVGMSFGQAGEDVVAVEPPRALGEMLQSMIPTGKKT